jgi:hypothetical protein
MTSRHGVFTPPAGEGVFSATDADDPVASPARAVPSSVPRAASRISF